MPSVQRVTVVLSPASSIDAGLAATSHKSYGRGSLCHAFRPSGGLVSATSAQVPSWPPAHCLFRVAHAQDVIMDQKGGALALALTAFYGKHHTQMAPVLCRDEHRTVAAAMHTAHLHVKPPDRQNRQSRVRPNAACEAPMPFPG